jgi:transposase
MEELVDLDKRKKPRRPRGRKAKKIVEAAVERTHPNAAGIDIGSDSHWVAVPQGRAEVPVREFRSFTADLDRLADWLTACGVTTVAMESTGFYWVPLYDLLEQRGFEVYLVNARHARNVPGRKSDVLDCQWIQQLHSFGLLRRSFRPTAEVVRLRSYLRHREMLVQYAAAHIQHMQKSLALMNLQLHNVISDITGVTGMRIVRALVAGQYDPQALAEFRDYRCHATKAEIAASLVGNYREEHLFALRQALALFDDYQAKILECDTVIETVLASLRPKDAESLPPPPPPRKTKGPKRPYRNEPAFEVRDPVYRVFGVDLSQIPGIAPYTTLRLLAEIGTDTTRWPTERHFCSWLALSPGTKISGGRVLDARTRPSANRAALYFRLAALNAGRTETAIGAYYRRLAASIGKGKAVVATAHKLARIVYAILRDRKPFQDPGARTYNAQQRHRIVRNIQKRAHDLGYQLVPTPKSAKNLNTAGCEGAVS